MNENYETVKAIADGLDMIIRGDMYVCPECGELIDSYVESEDADGWTIYNCNCGCVTDTQPEQAIMSDFCMCMDPYDIEYRIGGAGEYRSVRILIACGGPNIYIDSASGTVELYWWTEHASYGLSADVIVDIDYIYSSLYDRSR